MAGETPGNSVWCDQHSKIGYTKCKIEKEPLTCEVKTEKGIKYLILTVVTKVVQKSEDHLYK